MNPSPQILDLNTATIQTATAAESPPHFEHRGNGKIARLPKIIRDQINNWILDGVTYPDIIQRLGEHGKDLKPDNLSQWKKRGYQDWLRQREWLEHLASKSEFSADILAAPDSSALHEAGLRVAAAQMLDQLMRFGTALNTGDPQGQPETLARLANALSRLSREALAFQKYRDACAKTLAAELKRLDPSRELSDREHEIIAQRCDDFFLKPRRKPRPTPPVPSVPLTDPLAHSLATPSAPLVPGNPIQHQPSSIQQPVPVPLTDSPTHPLTPPVVPVPLTDSLAHSLTPPPAPEHCLHCGDPLPPLLPDGQRPSPWCAGCKYPICGDPGFSIREFCPSCEAAVPVHGYNVKRLSNICSECHTRLPDLDPNAPLTWLPLNSPFQLLKTHGPAT